MPVYKCYPGGRFKALTMSYDDSNKEDRRLVKLFNDNGIKGTFNITPGWFNNPDKIPRDEIKELYAGHEVACHTYTHPTLERCPITEVIDEVMKCRQELEGIVGYQVRGMAYPNGSYNKEIVNLLPSLGIEYSRIVGDTDSFSMPADFLTWKSTCHHDHNLMENAKRFVEASKSQYMFLMYVWGHSYEFSRDNTWGLIEEFCNYAGRREDIWYATNIEIVDYMKLLNNLKFSAVRDTVYNPSAASAWLSADGRIVEVKGGMQVSI